MCAALGLCSAKMCVCVLFVFVYRCRSTFQMSRTLCLSPQRQGHLFWPFPFAQIFKPPHSAYIDAPCHCICQIVHNNCVRVYVCGVYNEIRVWLPILPSLLSHSLWPPFPASPLSPVLSLDCRAIGPLYPGAHIASQVDFPNLILCVVHVFTPYYIVYRVTLEW